MKRSSKSDLVTKNISQWLVWTLIRDRPSWFLTSAKSKVHVNPSWSPSNSVISTLWHSSSRQSTLSSLFHVEKRTSDSGESRTSTCLDLPWFWIITPEILFSQFSTFSIILTTQIPSNKPLKSDECTSAVRMAFSSKSIIKHINWKKCTSSMIMPQSPVLPSALDSVSLEVRINC